MAQVRSLSGQVVRVDALGDRLAASVTTAILKSAQLELIRLVLSRGKVLPMHSVPGEITLLCIEGQFELVTPEGTLTLGVNDLVHLAGGVPHSLKAVQDTSALLTIRL